MTGHEHALEWDDGIGYLAPGPEAPTLYDETYWSRYVERSATSMGAKLTAARIGLVESYAPGVEAVDIGIGSGLFVDSRPSTWGYDVNPVAVAWLKERGKWANPYLQRFPVATFWDSLEHIADPGTILKQITDWVFVSMPVYPDVDAVYRSKHFKPSEHIWFFSAAGLERFMRAFGWTLVYRDDRETKLGRESIDSFVFRREP